MKNNLVSFGLRSFALLTTTLLAASLFSACKSPSVAQSETKTKAAAVKVICINAGATTPLTDPDGNTWLPDQGFVGGQAIDRANIEITGTKNPAIYRTEHYGMTSFSQPVPNGNYTVKLHFAETFARVTEKGQRVFSVKVEDKEIKDLDVFARAGGLQKAYVESVEVQVTDGKLDIAFTPGVQNPEINGIEILPR